MIGYHVKLLAPRNTNVHPRLEIYNWKLRAKKNLSFHIYNYL